MKRRRWRLFRRIATTAAALAGGAAALAGGAYAGLSLHEWMRSAPEFAVAEIQVLGNRLMDTDEAIALSGLRKGVNIFETDLVAARMRIGRDPRVRDVLIRRRYPDRLCIHVTERTPAALISLDRVYGIDAEGALIPLPTERLPVLPIITGLQAEEATVEGGRPERLLRSDQEAKPGRSAVRQALHVLDVVRRTVPELSGRLSEIHVARPHDPVLYIAPKGTAVRLGVGRYREKLRRLRHILKRLDSDGITAASIDLRFDRQAVVRPVVAGSPDETRL